MTKQSFCSMAICLAVILLSGCEAACSYEFEEDSEYVTLKENSKGKMIATLKMWDDIFGLGQDPACGYQRATALSVRCVKK